MTTEAYRVRCDGCGALEEVSASAAGEPEGWTTITFEFTGEPFRSSYGRGSLYGHICADCTAAPIIQSFIRAVPGYERAAEIAAEAEARAAGET